MFLSLLRALFVLLMAAVGWFILSTTTAFKSYTWLCMAITLVLAVLIICIDILAPRRKLQIFSGTFLGLFVGLLVTYALSFVIKLLVDQFIDITGMNRMAISTTERETILAAVNLVVGLICCYLCISFVLQTRDDFRFIVPYVEFSKQTKGNRPILLDTSALIDGRIRDIVETGLIESQLVVPRFVLDELQTVADSEDKMKRSRGRRGLEVLTKLRETRRADVIIYDSSLHDRREMRELRELHDLRETHEAHDDHAAVPGMVDQKLVILAKHLSARVLTTDFNLNKVAQLSGVDVININDLSNALKPVVSPGERMIIRLVNPGEAEGQGVGYLDDGTMVVVEQGRAFLGQDVEINASRVIQTSAGRMIFARLADSPAPSPSSAPAARPPRRHAESPSRT